MQKKIFTYFCIISFICILLLLDVLTGYEFDFFVFYFIPVGAIAWYFGSKQTILCSILCAFVSFYADYLSGQIYSSNFVAAWNTCILLISYLVIGLSTAKINILLKSEKIKTDTLQTALDKVKILESFLSICCSCKKIRNEDGAWQPIESYISNHSETRFSHGYCPECLKQARKEAGLSER
jgi:hypothetical protein